jgi:hypothetical protein
MTVGANSPEELMTYISHEIGRARDIAQQFIDALGRDPENVNISLELRLAVERVATLEFVERVISALPCIALTKLVRKGEDGAPEPPARLN